MGGTRGIKEKERRFTRVAKRIKVLTSWGKKSQSNRARSCVCSLEPSLPPVYLGGENFSQITLNSISLSPQRTRLSGSFWSRLGFSGVSKRGFGNDVVRIWGPLAWIGCLNSLSLPLPSPHPRSSVPSTMIWYITPEWTGSLCRALETRTRAGVFSITL